MSVDDFREGLLQVMERKEHWAWPAFTGGMVPKSLLHIHLEQEYAVYVRDFPVLIGRAYVQCPDPVVRAELVENMYEEETGGLSKTRAHPELFLEYPRGLGFNLSRFEAVELLPGARRYRQHLDHVTSACGWEVGCVITTLFLEGTAHERGEIDENAPKRPAPPFSEHPLVKHYGLPEASLSLTKAHRSIEGDHRQAAWRIVLGHVGAQARPRVLAAMEDTLALWKAYRDDVAVACGLEQDEKGAPRPKA
jgi:pyrroloquinoline-quinone synthase